MFNLNYPTTDLVGADYNPRKIDEEGIGRLCESVEALGIIKPIIVRGTTIVAGHQRTKALQRLGILTAPAFVISKKTTAYDEIRFNQLHNGTDFDSGDEAAWITEDLTGKHGYIEVDHKNFEGNFRGKKAVVRSEICRLLGLYGNWGGCVATPNGNIIHAAQYALAAVLNNMAIRVYVLSQDQVESAKKYLPAVYGKFSYDNLQRDTFIQTFAQMFRLRGGDRDNKSPTYEKLVLPFLNSNKNSKVLDFGCGQGDYVKRLLKSGFNIIGIEFFRRKAGIDAFDLRAINGMVDALIESTLSSGRFDCVVCDYVMNSVDSIEAENDVLNCLDIFCKEGGHIFLSGRSSERIESLQKMTKTSDRVRYIEFLDDDGFTALYRKGAWFYQKFHNKRQIKDLCKKRGWTIVKEHRTNIGWNIEIKKGVDVIPIEDVSQSLYREFNMPLNKKGKTLERGADILELLPCLQN
jgi:ParB family chromosome partitioning protein